MQRPAKNATPPACVVRRVMVKKCCVPNCKSGYSTNHYVTEFSFPCETNLELRRKWILAIRRKDFTVTKNTFVCENHFEEKFIRQNNSGQKRLRWDMEPVPSIFPYPPSVRATSHSQTKRNPRKRVKLSDELEDFQKKTKFIPSLIFLKLK